LTHGSTHVKQLDYCHGNKPRTLGALGRGASCVIATLRWSWLPLPPPAGARGVAPEGGACFSNEIIFAGSAFTLGVWRFGMMDLGASKSWRLEAELDWRRARVAADLD
jgi:hypothetical protein